MDEIAPRIWRWASRHPDWSPGAFGAEVGSYALVGDDDLLLVDPLLPEEDAEVLAALDGLAAGRAVHVLLTLEYHVRSTDALAARLGACVHGPAEAGPRLTSPLRVWEPGVAGPGGVVPQSLDPRAERPLWFPSHAALVFGDEVVTTPDGELRVWEQDPLDAERLGFHREHLGPQLGRLAGLPVEHVLTTHGAPVLGGGADALRAAIAKGPWEFRD